MLLNRPRANDIMDREGLDALVAVSANNVCYLSDFESDFLYDVPWVACAILPRDPGRPACLIVTEIEAAVLVQKPTWMPELKIYFFGIYGGVLRVHTFAEPEALSAEDQAIRRMVALAESGHFSSVMQAAAAALRERGLTTGRIGLDDTRFAAAVGDTLQDATVVDATNLFLEIRMVKTPDEIAMLRAAATKNQIAMSRAIDAIRDGATWLEVSRAYEVAVAEQGARVFASFNGAGSRSAGAARPDAAYPIRPGDQVCFDSMLKWRRYIGDAQRTVVLGEPSAKATRYWRAYAAGIAEAYDTLRPGVNTGDLRNRTIDTVRRNGMPSFELAFSHGIGLDHIEVPFIAGGTLGDFPVVENMVLNIDMELHEIGWGGLFFEESMLVTRDGAERLYTLKRDLIIV
jgi:Xaa-Pro aminopeptidase